MTKKLAVIDGKSVFYRGYYAMPNLALSDGTPTGGVFGFASLAIELIKKLEPDYVAVAWDKKGTNIRKRREIYPEYKAGRKAAPDDFYAQIPILYELLEAFGWPLYELDDYEADDILGAFAKQAEAKDIETCLLTSDLDALQLVGPKTKVYALKNGLSNIQEFDIDSFEAKYGISVEQFLDLKSLKGDASDNLPGVPGVGEKTAINLLQQYGDLDNIYEHLDDLKPNLAKKLSDGKKLAYICKEVGRIWVDAPIELDWAVADVDDTDLDQVAEILKKLEFTSLVRRLPKHMQQQADLSLFIEQKHQASTKKVAWPEKVLIDGPVVLDIKGEDVWCSLGKETVSVNSVANIDPSFWKILEMAEVVAYDIKQLYHDLDKLGVKARFDNVHDIRQAAFLIDPLKRDRSLSGLLGEEISEGETEISALWQVFAWQKDALANLPKVAKIASEMDFPLTYDLYNIEKRGVRIDTKKLAQMSQELLEDYSKIEQEIYDIVGREFNIASPAQLAEVLFVDLKLPTTGIKRGKTGFSTGQKELDKLRGKSPIIEKIELAREIAKLKNTYVDALPKLVDQDSRLHTTFNQDVASTGRLSSTNPNLQNIPIRSELGRKIRQAFVADKGNVLVSADYSQFELRLAAVMSGDQELIDDFNSGVDIHAKTASELYDIALDDVNKTQRGNAKTINFSVLYGVSPHGLAANTGMSFGEAKDFIKKYFELRAPIRNYLDKILDQARKDGYVETFYGRRRPTPDVHSPNFVVRQAAERAAMNMPIQGTEADLMKRAMIDIDKKLDGVGEQILQIHDSIMVECPTENADQVAKILQDIMENIAPELDIHLKVDVHTGKHWGEL